MPNDAIQQMNFPDSMQWRSQKANKTNNQQLELVTKQILLQHSFFKNNCQTYKHRWCS